VTHSRALPAARAPAAECARCSAGAGTSEAAACAPVHVLLGWMVAGCCALLGAGGGGGQDSCLLIDCVSRRPCMQHSEACGAEAGQRVKRLQACCQLCPSISALQRMLLCMLCTLIFVGAVLSVKSKVCCCCGCCGPLSPKRQSVSSACKSRLMACVISCTTCAAPCCSLERFAPGAGRRFSTSASS